MIACTANVVDPTCMTIQASVHNPSTESSMDRQLVLRRQIPATGVAIPGNRREIHRGTTVNQIRAALMSRPHRVVDTDSLIIQRFTVAIDQSFVMKHSFRCGFNRIPVAAIRRERIRFRRLFNFWCGHRLPERVRHRMAAIGLGNLCMTLATYRTPKIHAGLGHGFGKGLG